MGDVLQPSLALQGADQKDNLVLYVPVFTDLDFNH